MFLPLGVLHRGSVVAPPKRYTENSSPLKFHSRIDHPRSHLIVSNGACRGIRSAPNQIISQPAYTTRGQTGGASSEGRGKAGCRGAR